MPRLDVWSDLHCPYAYLAAHRLRKLAPEFPRVEIEPRALPIEYLDEKPTPKAVLDAEAPIVLLGEPDIEYAPWHASPSHWPSTMWPTFEAVKCARRQGLREALELDWRIREAFWRRSECIALRHVLARLASDAGLDRARFVDDFDAGVAKREVIEDAREGWETLKLKASPTLIGPDGVQHTNPAAPLVVLDEDLHHKVVEVKPPREKEAPEAWYRALLSRVALADQTSGTTRSAP